MEFIKKKIFYMLLILIILLLSFIYIIFFYRGDYLNNDNWYSDNKYIGHALYGADGYSYLNSRESLEFGYSKGIRIMEVDLLYTSDNMIIANHVWNNDEILIYSEFMNGKIYNKYSPVDLEILINYMIMYEDLYVVIDTKEEYYSDYNKFLNIYKQFVDYCKTTNPTLLDRVIIQIYDYDMYYDIEEIYSFDNYIFSIYKISEFNILELCNFCIYHNIDIIALPEWLIDVGIIKENYIEFIKYKGLGVWVYTINDRNKEEELYSNGIDGIYTDFLY